MSAVAVVSRGVEETEALGARLGRVLRSGDLLDLRGPLGAGKTCFVRGLATGLGADPVTVRSPTFVLHHVYRAPALTLHHIDLYRLGEGTGLDVLDLDTLLDGGAVAVEWGDYADLAPWQPLPVIFEPGEDPGERRISLGAAGPDHLRAAWREGV